MILTAALAIGYHGCDKSVGEAAIAGTHPMGSTNRYDWLGHGLYFWENDRARALQWATLHGATKEPFVLGAVIVLGNCLDLVDVEHISLLKEAYENLRVTFESAGTLNEFPQNQPGYKGDKDLLKRNLDCAVINNLHVMHIKSGRPAFDTVRSPFSEGEPVFEGSGIMAKTHIQLCVRVPSKSILGYFRPLSDS